VDKKQEEADLSTNYATERVSSAIWKHLMNLDVVPPTKESARLATEITEVVWTELEYVGLSKETLEKFFTASNKTRAQGKAWDSRELRRQRPTAESQIDEVPFEPS
jgi:hypothetical protein